MYMFSLGPVGILSSMFDGILCLFLGSGDGVSSKPRSFLHFGDGVKWIFLLCLFLGSGDGVFCTLVMGLS